MIDIEDAKLSLSVLMTKLSYFPSADGQPFGDFGTRKLRNLFPLLVDKSREKSFLPSIRHPGTAHLRCPFTLSK